MGHEDSCEYFITLFIPAYNRENSLGETLESILQSKAGDFEVIIVDDGSIDNTPELITHWQNKANFPLRYIRQENSGKMQAHNKALSYASGFMFMTLDAGDLLLPDALGSLKTIWTQLPPGEKENLAGIGVLCLTEDGSVAGKKYSVDGINANYFEMLSATGEKRHAIRTSVLKQYPYPRIEGEKHIRIDLILKRMAHRYRFWFVNLPVQINRREADGITATIKKYRLNNPKGYRLFFMEEITLNKHYYDKRKLYGDHWRYVQYSLHSGVGLRDQLGEVHDKFLWFLAIPKGTFKWLIDSYRIQRL